MANWQNGKSTEAAVIAANRQTEGIELLQDILMQNRIYNRYMEIGFDETIEEDDL